MDKEIALAQLRADLGEITPSPAEYESENEGTNDPFEKIRKRNFNVVDDDSSDQIEGEKNVSNSVKKRKNKKSIEETAKAIVKMDFASKRYDIKLKKTVVATENGTFTNETPDTRYSIHGNVWEAIRGLPNRNMVMKFLDGQGWLAPSVMDPLYTGKRQTSIPFAPIQFQVWWDAAFLRMLMKMVDDAPKTRDDKLVHLIFFFMIKI